MWLGLLEHHMSQVPFYHPCLVHFYLREMVPFYESCADTKCLMSGLPPLHNLNPQVQATQYDTGLYAVICSSLLP